MPPTPPPPQTTKPRTEPVQQPEATREIAREVLREHAASQALYRRSRQQLVRDYPRNPENFDILKEATLMSMAKGHRLAAWGQAVPAAVTGREPDDVRDFWQTSCMTCGFEAYARWRRSLANDKDGEGVCFPEIGGRAIVKTEAECLRLANRSPRRIEALPGDARGNKEG